LSIAVVMPAWNESEGIVGFIDELLTALAEWQPRVIIINDSSTDETELRLQELVDRGLPVQFSTNEANSGHGPSTIRALQLGLVSGAQRVISIDGDGQFVGEDVARLVSISLEGRQDIVEGVRTSREDPAYRKFVSATTRTLVWTRSRSWPKDANTPLRVYRPEILADLLEVIPASASTPNLLISALSRRWPISLAEVEVTSIPRRGSDSNGSTWGIKRKALPSKRFVSFCRKAIREWISTPIAGSK
jgi:glycosyltransferase involved in cell wall biosynthesis